jgi:UEV domain/Vps23 core domain
MHLFSLQKSSLADTSWAARTCLSVVATSFSLLRPRASPATLSSAPQRFSSITETTRSLDPLRAQAAKQSSMAPGPPARGQTTLQLLRSTRQYPRDAEELLVDQISSVTRAFPSLLLAVDTYTSNTGAVQTLAHLSGTIPVVYCRATYNIPVRIWVLSCVPRSGPPVVYVTPTSSMLLKNNHQCLNSEGRVYLPELTSWSPAASSIRAVVEKMIVVFSNDPPVYARPVVSTNSILNPAPPSNYSNGEARERQRLVALLSERASRHFAELTNEQRVQMAALRNEMEAALGTKSVLVDALQEVRVEPSTAQPELAALKQEHKAIRDAIISNKVADGDIGVDSVIRTTDVLSGQDVDCVVRDTAYQDLLDGMVGGVENNRIDVETFLKETRRLSSEQFNVRALRFKVCLAKYSCMVLYVSHVRR